MRASRRYSQRAVRKSEESNDGPLLFERIVAPVADDHDARSTCRTLGRYAPYVVHPVEVVHVIEKGGGAPDKAPLELRREYAENVFGIVSDELESWDVPFETRVLYGTDIAETILTAARDIDASAIVFTPRGGGRWVKLLAGDVTQSILKNNDLSRARPPEPRKGRSMMNRREKGRKGSSRLSVGITACSPRSRCEPKAIAAHLDRS